jgi:hypothetical protein
MARACALARACFRVGWIHTRIADPDQYLTIFRFRGGRLPQAHDIWFTVAIKNHCAHIYYLLLPRELAPTEEQPQAHSRRGSSLP